MAVKPVPHLDWVTGDEVARITEPSSGKKLLGWVASERPPFQFWNWGWNKIDKWLKYFEEVTDTLQGQYDIVIGDTGTDPMATHDTLQDAVDDVGVGNNQRVLVKEAYEVDTVINLSKPGWRITFAPGADYTSGTSNDAIQLNADRLELHGARFIGFSGVAVESLAGADFCRVMNCNFLTCPSEIDDTLAAVVTLGNITE